MAGDTPEPRALPQRIERQLKAWNSIAVLLRVAEVLCAVLGIAGPIYLATAPGLPNRYIVTAALSSLATLGAAAFKLAQRATKWRSASSGLSNAAARFEMGLDDATALSDALAHGEELIRRAGD